MSIETRESESSVEPPRYSVGCCVNKRDELLHTSWLASRSGGSSVKWNVMILGELVQAARERKARV